MWLIFVWERRYPNLKIDSICSIGNNELHKRLFYLGKIFKFFFIIFEILYNVQPYHKNPLKCIIILGENFRKKVCSEKIIC